MHIEEQTGRSLISFGSMTSSHERKRTLFFLSVRHSLFRVLFPSSVWKTLGAKYRVLLTLIEWTSFCFEFWLETGEFEEKVKKEVFWMGKNRQTWLIFVGDPQVSPTISQGSIIFFLLEDMSMMCLSLLTNSVGLTVKELELIPNRSFSLKSAYDIYMKDLTFLHMLCCSVSINPGLQSLQYYMLCNIISLHSYLYLAVVGSRSVRVHCS